MLLQDSRGPPQRCLPGWPRQLPDKARHGLFLHARQSPSIVCSSLSSVRMLTWRGRASGACCRLPRHGQPGFVVCPARTNSVTPPNCPTRAGLLASIPRNARARKSTPGVQPEVRAPAWGAGKYSVRICRGAHCGKNRGRRTVLTGAQPGAACEIPDRHHQRSAFGPGRPWRVP